MILVQLCCVPSTRTRVRLPCLAGKPLSNYLAMLCMASVQPRCAHGHVAQAIMQISLPDIYKIELVA